MVITVNGSCGLTATATNFNSINSVPNSISQHSLTSVSSNLASNRSTAFSQLTNPTVQSLNSNHGNNYPYLSAASAYGSNTTRTNFLNDELLTNMYQPTNVQHIAQNQMTTQLDLNTLQSNQSTQIAHPLDSHLDQLYHSIHHPSSSFSLLNSPHTQSTHLIDQTNSLQSLNNQFTSSDNLHHVHHDASLNAPELSYDFSRLISNNRTKRKQDDELSSSKTKANATNQSSHFESIKKQANSLQVNKNALNQLNLSNKSVSGLEQQQRTNLQSSPCLNQQQNLMNKNFITNSNQRCNSRPNSANSEFNQQQQSNRLHTGLLTIATNEQQQHNLANSIGLNSLMSTNKSSSASQLSNLVNSNLQSTYSSHQNSLKLHIKTEPDEQRDFTSACTSDNSIYSPCALSNSTELTGYPSPNNLLFNHVLNG